MHDPPLGHITTSCDGPFTRGPPESTAAGQVMQWWGGILTGRPTPAGQLGRGVTGRPTPPAGQLGRGWGGGGGGGGGDWQAHTGQLGRGALFGKTI